MRKKCWLRKAYESRKTAATLRSGYAPPLAVDPDRQERIAELTALAAKGLPLILPRRTNHEERT